MNKIVHGVDVSQVVAIVPTTKNTHKHGFLYLIVFRSGAIVEMEDNSVIQEIRKAWEKWTRIC